MEFTIGVKFGCGVCVAKCAGRVEQAEITTKKIAEIFEKLTMRIPFMLLFIFLISLSINFIKFKIYQTIINYLVL